MKVAEADKLDGVAEAVAVTGASKRTIARHVAAGTFPAPIYILGRRRWRRADLVAWASAEAAKPRRVRGRPWAPGCPSPNPTGRAKPNPSAEAP